eukprot:g82001.t1
MGCSRAVGKRVLHEAKAPGGALVLEGWTLRLALCAARAYPSNRAGVCQKGHCASVCVSAKEAQQKTRSWIGNPKTCLRESKLPECALSSNRFDVGRVAQEVRLLGVWTYDVGAVIMAASGFVGRRTLEFL